MPKQKKFEEKKEDKKEKKTLVVKSVRQHARRMTFSWGIIAIAFLFLGIFTDKVYYYWAIGLVVLDVYWIWRGWFWRKSIE